MSDNNSFKNKLNKKSSYDDLSSFLDEEDEIDSNLEASKEKSLKENNSLKPKSVSPEDFALKKARIIEGTNFDNRLRKSKKSKKSSKSKKSKK